MKKFLSKLILFFLLILSIASVQRDSEGCQTNTNFKTVIESKDIPPEFYPEDPFSNRLDRKTDEELIKYGLFLDNKDPFEKFPPINSTLEQEKTNNKHLRQLERDGTTLSGVGFFNFSQGNNNGKSLYAYKYIFQNLKRYSSKFIVYPYGFDFTYMNETGTELNDTMENGGVFTLEPDKLPTTFNKITDITNVKIGKSKALYDIHIAILRFDSVFDDVEMNFFQESDYYQTFLIDHLGKISTIQPNVTEFRVWLTNHPTTGGITYIDPDEILDGELFYGDKNFFDMLIVPDFVYGTEKRIKDKLTDKGVDYIKKFVERGGTLLASGKSGYLLELFGLVKEGTYDINYLTKTTASGSSIEITGCEEIVQLNEDEDSNESSTDSSILFTKKLLCLNNPTSSYLSSAFKIVSKDTDYETVIYIKNIPENKLVYLDFNGNEESIETSVGDIPFISFKKYGKGKIFVIDGNPLYKCNLEKNSASMFNIIFDAMSKGVIFNNYISFGDKPIPGGESGILLDNVIEFYNIFDTEIEDFEMIMFFPSQVNVTDFSSDCVISTEKVEGIDSIKYMDMSWHLKCRKQKLEKFEQFKEVIKIEILDAQVTQIGTSVPLNYPFVNYTDSTTSAVTWLDIGYTTVEAKLAALLRGAINPDPSSFYPIHGEGDYADLVIKVENKENTIGYDVDYISVIPLISPVLDGYDQQSVAYLVKVFDKYYHKHGYTFPWTQTGSDSDYVDYYELSNKNIVFIAEWDTPVKIGKSSRVDAKKNFGINETWDGGDLIPDPIDSIDQINPSLSTTINNTQVVLHQIYFKDSDIFYELATQRQMAFIDTTKANGAKAVYGDNAIDEKLADAENNEVTKKDIGWCRVDIFFYDSIDYQYPTGLNETVLISLDKYPNNSIDYSVTQLGKLTPDVTVQGHFDSTKSPTLKPNEYENLMVKYGFHKQYNPEVKEDMEKLLEMTNNTIKYSHYLVPVKDTGIKRAGNIMDFIENEDQKTGYHEEYPSIKFIYAHCTNITVKAEETRQGGLLKIKILSAVEFTGDPIENDYITVSADEVSFYKTEYDQENKLISMYFKRGLLPYESYGKPTTFSINLEGLNTQDSISLSVELFEMKYDITSPDTNYENYKKVKTFESEYKANYIAFYRLPCMIIHNYLDKRSTKAKEENSTTGNEEDETLNTAMLEYELLNPYTRYGIYFQELLNHRYIWGSTEAHHVTNPGLQAISGGMALISNIGTCSVPGAEYVTTGLLLIPAAITQSRLEWTDIWGRRWHQPLRSVFPDVPPIPPPLRNFMMSTTFEVLSKDGNERFLTWPADQSAVIHTQVKFLNNYPKYFLPTTCKNNEIVSFKTNPGNFEREREFTDIEYEKITESNDNSFLMQGFTSVYGTCYPDTSTSYLSGTKIDSTIYSKMKDMMLCASTMSEQEIADCANSKSSQNLPTLKRQTADDKEDPWNYSKDIEKYYPENYIKGNMWNLTHYDYDDTPMDKGYKYHMDNNLPGLDVSPSQNPAYIKPHNVIFYPLFKGFGYKIDYSKDFTIPKFHPYKGWWSDNLQNKDNTLVAGQEKSNDVSVDKESLLKDSDWVDGFDLYNEANDKLAAERLKNIYVCDYNRHRVRVTAKQSRYAYPNNVYINNVVPVIPELTADDKRYTEYECSKDSPQYYPENISKVDNVLETSNDRDWLYFAINLRGGARETINILTTLTPYSETKYEGSTKVQDGGRFSYWNPANGPNSFLVVDNPVNVIESYRIDHDIISYFLPSTISTFNSVAYQVHEIKDTNEILREYKENTYTNNYGFGDSTISVYVGGTQGTVCKLNPGDYTLVKITFYNNAGFDWNLKSKGIKFEKQGEKAISGDDLLKGIVHSIQAPIEYYFMKVKVPDELVDYIDIRPSDHNKAVAPEFFDFQNINVVTIRDGFEGIYYYKISIKEGFPDKYKGRLLEFPVELDETMFESLPSYNDPTTNYHNYHLQIPPIKLGVKYGEDSEYAGKVFYTLGRATDLKMNYRLSSYFETEEIKLITEEEKAQLSIILGDKEGLKQRLEQFWNGLTDNYTNIQFTTTPIDNDKSFNLVTVDLSSIYPEFPYEVLGKPDIANFSIIARSSALFVEYGYRQMIKTQRTTFTDPRKQEKTSALNSEAVYASISGPWVKVSCTGELVTKNLDGSYTKSKSQSLYRADSGVIKLNLTTKNTGSATSYNVNYQIFIPGNLTILENLIDYNYTLTRDSVSDDQILYVELNRNIEPNIQYMKSIYLAYDAIESNETDEEEVKYSNDEPEQQKYLTILNKAEVFLYQSEGDIQYNDSVMESLPINYTVEYNNFDARRIRINLFVSVKGSFSNPKINLFVKNNDKTGTEFQYIYYRLILYKEDRQFTIEDFKMFQNTTQNSTIDYPLKDSKEKNYKTYKVVYFVEAYAKNQRITSSKYLYVENTSSTNHAVFYSILGPGLLLLVMAGIYIYYRYWKKKYRRITMKSKMDRIITSKPSGGERQNNLDSINDIDIEGNIAYETEMNIIEFIKELTKKVGDGDYKMIDKE